MTVKFKTLHSNLDNNAVQQETSALEGKMSLSNDLIQILDNMSFWH